MHSVANNLDLRQKLIAAGYKPSDIASLTIEEVNTLIQKIFPEMYNEAGDPDFEIVEEIPDRPNANGRALVATVYDPYINGNQTPFSIINYNKILLAHSAFNSYFKLAGTIGHELFHQINYVNGNYTKYLNQKGKVWARAKLEVRAYDWQYEIGVKSLPLEYFKFKNILEND